ncbi:hypothetical protein [Actinoplanes sp. NPDC049802]|uniref:hypothetical protein n=1 Tax=Actinoplanes sp. NPDC049802 TaxID=3154742 RepID=UPI0033E29BBA
MVVPALLIIAMAVCAAVALWPVRRPRPVPPVPPAGAVAPIPRAESTEGLLVVQLFRGDLTREQYHRAMACLAERDAGRHPLPLPE